MSLLSRGVLVVDDSAVIRSVMRDRLKQLGVDPVLIAENAEQAVACFEENNPEIILLDITMPEVPGTRVAHHILRRDPHAKVVVVTAMSRDTDLVESAIAGGAFAYLRKPVSDKDLKALIDRVRNEDQKSGPLHPWGPQSPTGPPRPLPETS